MKINRLIEITIILLNRKTITAAELANRFDVSTRTIYRDIDVLSSSGVPIFCSPGANGGISILDHYTLNRTTFTQKEYDHIAFALQSLMASKYPETEMILDKLGSLFQVPSTDWISIDFTSWGNNPNEYNRFETIKQSILDGTIIEIEYVNANNIRSTRRIAPLRLMFKSLSWYLWGFCYKRNEFRTFRISRIRNVIMTQEHFVRKDLVSLTEHHEKECSTIPLVTLSLQFTKDVLSRILDDYDDASIREGEDDTYLVDVTYPEDEWLYGYLLSFGPYVKILSPDHMKETIIKRSLAVVAQYNESMNHRLENPPYDEQL